MCDCIFSSPLSSPFLKTKQIRRPRIVPYPDIYTPPSSSSSSNPPTIKYSNFTCARNGGLRIVKGSCRTSIIRATRLGSEGKYEFYGESKDKGKDPFELGKSDADLRMRNGEKGNDEEGLDFLKMEDERMEKGGSEEDNLLRIEGTGSSDGVEEEEEKAGEEKLRRRQVIKRSNMLAKQVISIESALSLGFVSQLWVDIPSWTVLFVEVRPNLLSGEADKVLLEDVSQVGDVVLVENESVMENEFRMVGLETLVGYKVVTPGRQNIGKVRGYTFDINSGAIESLELDSFGISIIPSSLVSTYALFVEDVLEVVYDTVVVHEAAASQIQRLTKGLWDTKNVRTSIDEVEDYYDFERPVRSNRGRSTRRSFNNQKSRPKKRESEDDWEVPMDYL